MAYCADTRSRQYEWGPAQKRLWRFIYLILGTVKYFMLLVSVSCAIAVLYLSVFADGQMATIAQFAEWGIIGALYSSIAGVVAGLFSRAETSGALSFRDCEIALRKLAAAFIVLFVAGVGFSLCVAALSPQGFLGLTISMPLMGFPSNAVWSAVMDPLRGVEAPGLAAVDLSPLCIALVLWALASVFRYGAYLQMEKDSVV